MTASVAATSRAEPSRGHPLRGSTADSKPGICDLASDDPGPSVAAGSEPGNGDLAGGDPGTGVAAGGTPGAGDAAAAWPIDAPYPCQMPAEGCDDRRHRRRGEVLERAIYAAVLAELGARGFGRLTYEGVADRAGTGKAALYRRWPTKVELVVSALTHALPELGPISTTGELRGDLLSCLRSMADGLAGPTGTYLRGMIGELHQHPELATALRQRLLAPRQESLRAVLAAGVQRGDVRPDALAPECVDAGLALLRQRFLELGPGLPDETITAIVDNVLVPMVRRLPEPTPAADRAGTSGANRPHATKGKRSGTPGAGRPSVSRAELTNPSRPASPKH